MLHRQNSDEHFELSPIKAMELAARRIPDVVSLAQGIPSFPTPEPIRQFIIEKIHAGLCDKYSLTIGLAELREEIAEHLLKDGLTVDPDTQIIVTAGSIEGITASILEATEPGDEVILPSPSYVSYQGAVGIARCKPVFVPLDEDRNFDFSIEKLSRAITARTRAILYAVPNNPTGTTFSLEATKKLVALALKHNLTIITDEVYKDFYYTSDPHVSPTQFLEAADHVVRVCSFSKAYAMTGWRVGFLHSSAARTRRMLKFHDAMVTCAPVASQYGAIAALKFGGESLAGFQKEFRRRRDYSIERLDRLSTFLDYQVPKAAYFVFPRIKDTVPLARNSRALAYDILERSKVALVPGVAFGPTGESHLRISYGREMEDLERGFDRLSNYFLETKNKAPQAVSRKSLDSESVHVSATYQPGVTEGVRSQITAPSTREKAASFILKCAAKARLLRHRPVTIGVFGVRGKTTFKRTIASVLSPFFRTRAGLLSYNTITGLPLSILGLPARAAKESRISFALQALGAGFFGSSDEQVLILEYGATNAAEAEKLLSIVRPDYLVVTTIETTEPRSELKSDVGGVQADMQINMRDALACFTALLSKESILFSGKPVPVAQVRKQEEIAAPFTTVQDELAVGETGQIALHTARYLLTLLRQDSRLLATQAHK